VVAAVAVDTEVVVITEGEIPTEILTEIPTVIEDMIEVVTEVAKEELIIMTPELLENPELLECTDHQYAQNTVSLWKTCHLASVGRT